MTSAIVPIDVNRSVDNVKLLHNLVKKLRQDVLKEGEDYGTVPGTDKATLLLPGIEKVTRGMELVPEFIERHVVRDYKEGLFVYEFECRLKFAGTDTICPGGVGLGSCNSMESSFRWRWVPESRLPAGMDTSTLEKRNGTISELQFAVEKKETTGKYGKPAEYWNKFQDAIDAGTAKVGKRTVSSGKEMATWIIGGVEYRVPNPEIFDQANAILKRAKKRAWADAIKGAANVSEFFTVDMEDFTPYTVSNPDGENIVEGTFTEVVEKPTPPAPVEETVKGEPFPPLNWTENGSAQKWVKDMLAEGYTDSDMKLALVINERWSEWDGTAEEASVALINYMANLPKAEPVKETAVTDVGLVDTDGGEIIETPWTKKEQDAAFKYWNEDLALSGKDILEALGGIKKLADWKRSEASAKKAVSDWLYANLNGTKDPLGEFAEKELGAQVTPS